MSGSLARRPFRVTPPRPLFRLPRWPTRAAAAAWALLLALLLAWPGAASAQPPLQLQDGVGQVDAWPALTLLSDPDGLLDVAAVLRRQSDFRPPDGPHANLGPGATPSGCSCRWSPPAATAAGCWTSTIRR